MTRKLAALALIAVLAESATPQTPQTSDILIPNTSWARVEDLGVRAHTNFMINTTYSILPETPAYLFASLAPASFAGPAGFHPDQIRAAYGATSTTAGSGTIAVVIAYHYATALNDFNVFSTQFGLPTETATDATLAANKKFQIVYASGTKPTVDTGWNQEAALDIEWTHSMAPGAKIVLVEAKSSGFLDLFQAVTVAKGLPGVTQVSMSWGGNEFNGEASYDSYFGGNAAVTFFASSGDTGGVSSYPAQASNVVGVGGTSLKFATNAYSETAWSGSGGGQSPYEAKPSYQNSITSLTKRGGPDIAAVADPNTGVSVYCSTKNQGYVGWLVFGGTSVACPVVAGLANAGGTKRGTGELTWIYGHSTGFKDVTSGKAGSYSAAAGWDKVTGWGSPKSPTSL